MQGLASVNIMLRAPRRFCAAAAGSPRHRVPGPGGCLVAAADEALRHADPCDGFPAAAARGPRGADRSCGRAAAAQGGRDRRPLGVAAASRQA